jgi:hypothetical protein
MKSMIVNGFLWRSIGLPLHVLVEIPAAIGFLLFPSATLSKSQPEAHAVLRQYGILLFSTNIIVAFFLSSKMSMPESVYEFLERRVAGALALYHVGPLCRAAARIYRQGRAQHVLTGPWLHLALHGICFISLASIFGRL